MSADIEGLIGDTLGGLPGAQEQLARCFLPLALGWCARLGGPRVDAEDAAHDVLIVALTRLDGLRDRAAWRSWLYGITRRVLARHRRSAWVRRWVDDVRHDMARDPGDSPSETAALSQRARHVQAILEGLPSRQREVLVLCDAEERTAPEVAELLGIPEGTVRSRLRVARQRFQVAAAGRGLDPELQLASEGVS